MPRLHLDALHRLTRPHPASAATAWRGWLALAVLAAAVGFCAQAATALDVRLVAFPSSTNSNVLRMAQVSAGHWFQAVGHYQPSSLSYSVGATFGMSMPGGGDLYCQTRAEGWARPQVLTGTPLRLVCVCEQRRLHNRRPISCLQAAQSGARP